MGSTIYDAVMPDLPGITVTAEVNPRKRNVITVYIEPGGKAVTYSIPDGATVEQVAKFVRDTRHRVIKWALEYEQADCHIGVKELVGGEGFKLFGRNHRLNIADGAEVPVRAVRAPSWTGSSWYLEVDRAHLSARTIVEWYRQQGQEWLDRVVPALAQRAGVKTGPGGFTWGVRPFRAGVGVGATWARCLHERNAFNASWIIFQFPENYAEHVIKHELCHAAAGPGHGAKWQNAMDMLCGADWQNTQRDVEMGRRLRLWAGEVTPASVSRPFVSSWATLAKAGAR